MIRLALYSALSDRASESTRRPGRLLRRLGRRPRPRTRVAALDALGLDGKVLVVLGRDDARRPALASATSTNVTTIDAGELNAYDVLDADWVLFTDDTLPAAEGERLMRDAMSVLIRPVVSEKTYALMEHGHLRLRRRHRGPPRSTCATPSSRPSA